MMYKLMANYGFVGTETDFGEFEVDSEEEALDIAWELATDSVSIWVEKVDENSLV